MTKITENSTAQVRVPVAPKSTLDTAKVRGLIGYDETSKSPSMCPGDGEDWVRSMVHPGDLADAGTLSGSEEISLVQSGVQKKTTVSQIAANAGFVRTVDLGNTSDASKGAALVGLKGRTVRDRFVAEGFVNILDWDAARPTGGTSDQTAGIQQAIDETPEGWELHVPGGIHRYRIYSQIRWNRRIRMVGIGSGSYSMNDTLGVSSPPQFWIPGTVTGVDSMFKIGADPADDEVALMLGGGMENITFQCYDSHQNIALIEILGAEWFDIRRCSFYATSGRILRTRMWWDSLFQTNNVQECNRLADHPEVFLFDHHPADNNNNIWINGRNQFEGWRRGLFTVAYSGSYRMDGFWFRENKVEGNKLDSDGLPHAVFDLSGCSRAAIEENMIARINDAHESKVLVKAAATQACEISVQDNSFTILDTTTVLMDLSGPVGMTFDNNRNYNSTSPSVVTNASTLPIMYNPPRRSDIGNGVARARPEAIVGPFHSIHRWYGGDEFAPFVADSGTINVEGTACRLSGASKTVCFLGASLFQGSGCGVRVGIRCRSETGAGILDLKAGSPVASIGTRTIPIGWSTVWWTLNPDQVALISSTDTPLVQTSSTNAENVYIDGLYFLIEPAATIGDTSGTPRTQTMGDGAVAGNAGWIAKLTSTFAALFGLADPDGTVRWRMQMENAKDFLLTAFTVAPGTKIDDVLVVPNANSGADGGAATWNRPLKVKGNPEGVAAATGFVGEYKTDTKAPGAVAMASSGTTYTIASVSLTDGEWEVRGSVNASGTGISMTPASSWMCGLSTTAATLPGGSVDEYITVPTMTTLNVTIGRALTPRRFLVPAGTGPVTVYMVMKGTWTAGSAAGGGFMSARRVA